MTTGIGGTADEGAPTFQQVHMNQFKFDSDVSDDHGLMRATIVSRQLEQDVRIVLKSPPMNSIRVNIKVYLAPVKPPPVFDASSNKVSAANDDPFAMFQSELSNLAQLQLSKGYIVQLLGFIDEPEQKSLVFKSHVETLDKFIESADYKRTIMFTAAMQIISGLLNMHEFELTHCDI